MGEKYLKNTVILFAGFSSRESRLLPKVADGAGYSVVQATSLDSFTNLGEALAPQIIVLLGEGHTPLMQSILGKIMTCPAFSRSQIISLSTHILDQWNGYITLMPGRLHHLPAAITSTFFLEQIRTILKMRSPCSYSFKHRAPASAPKLQIQLKGEISKTHKGDFVLKAPARVAPDSVLKIWSSVLDNLGLARCAFRRTSAESVPAEKNQYYNEISLVGIDPDATSRIRKKQRGQHE